MKTKIVTVSTYNDDSYNENIYNKSYSREFISICKYQFSVLFELHPINPLFVLRELPIE